MAQITLKGNPINTNGNLPSLGSILPNFNLVKEDLSELNSTDLSGKKIILNIFPSIDTGTCATSVRTFNKTASQLGNSEVVCVSMDLPFALKRFCGAEGIDKVSTTSAFRSDFAEKLGLKIIDGPLAGLCARSVIVLNEKGEVTYTELVPETTSEPNYEAALAAIK